MGKDFYKAVEDRRTIYSIGKKSVIPDKEILEVVRRAVKNAPSAFNSQSERVVVLLGEYHDKLWNMTKSELKKIVPSENFSKTEMKINSFKNGYGTILFFEDQDIIKSMQKNFALYKDNFPIWAQQSSGMLQYIIWTSLELEGFGVSLQHYNPIIDEDVNSEYNIPLNWKLIAQMPFGKPTAPPDKKDFTPLDDRIKIFK